MIKRVLFSLLMILFSGVTPGALSFDFLDHRYQWEPGAGPLKKAPLPGTLQKHVMDWVPGRLYASGTASEGTRLLLERDAAPLSSGQWPSWKVVMRRCAQRIMPSPGGDLFWVLGSDWNGAGFSLEGYSSSSSGEPVVSLELNLILSDQEAWGGSLFLAGTSQDGSRLSVWELTQRELFLVWEKPRGTGQTRTFLQLLKEPDGEGLWIIETGIPGGEAPRGFLRLSGVEEGKGGSRGRSLFSWPKGLQGREVVPYGEAFFLRGRLALPLTNPQASMSLALLEHNKGALSLAEEPEAIPSGVYQIISAGEDGIAAVGYNYFADRGRFYLMTRLPSESWQLYPMER